MEATQLTQESWASGFIVSGFPFPPCNAHLGARFEGHDADLGVLRLSFLTKAEYANPAGTIQGGIVGAMLDEAMGPLVVAATSGAKVPVSTDLHMTFFKGVPIGPPCHVEARIDMLGGSVVFTSAVMRTEANDAVLVKATHTARLVEPRR